MEKGLTQSDVALDLGITPGTYSKIESGPTEISVKKLGAIAKILEVEMSYFFPGQSIPARLEDNNRSYGFAMKNDIEELTRQINKIKQEVAALKTASPAPGKKKKA